MSIKSQELIFSLLYNVDTQRGEQALFELICEAFKDGEEEFFNVSDSTMLNEMSEEESVRVALQKGYEEMRGKLM